MNRVPAVAAIVVLASATVAVAEDSPGLALAKQVVEAARGDAHREKMRIVWPESVEAAPPEGAEVTLIDGYISYGITRIKWRDGAGKLDACQLFAARSWFYNKDGEGFGARTTTIDASKFAVAWAAARYVLAAHDERLEPEPKDHPSTGSSGIASHTPHNWVRLRIAGADGPLHVSDKRGSSSNWENVVEWDDIRDESVFKLFEPFTPPSESAPPGRMFRRTTWSQSMAYRFCCGTRPSQTGSVRTSATTTRSCSRSCGGTSRSS